MNFFESFFLDNNFSWTTSKLLPYAFALLFGVIFYWFVRKKIGNYPSFLRRIAQIFVITFLFIFYFSFYPIYQGDFTNTSTQVERAEANNELNGQKLIVLSIPGCPYCYESIGKMKKLIERNPEIIVEYLVCSEDVNSLEWYKEGAGGKIRVQLAEDPLKMSQLAGGSFPTFVLVDNDSPLKVWSNNFFGVLAMDEVEVLLNKKRL